MDAINAQCRAAISIQQQKRRIRTNSRTCQLGVFTGHIAAATMTSVGALIKKKSLMLVQPYFLRPYVRRVRSVP